MFKEGDFVKCIEVGPRFRSLTKNKVYKIEKTEKCYDNSTNAWVYIINDLGKNEVFRGNRFVLLREKRNYTFRECLEKMENQNEI